MYSQEIKELLDLKNSILEVKEYLNVINTSPQINCIKYNCYDDNFYLFTDDNYKFKVKIKTK